MPDTLTQPVDPLFVCQRCNIEMRQFRIEKENDTRDRYTFECEKCGHIEVRGVKR